MIKKNLIIALSLLFACQLPAQNTVISVDAPETVSAGVSFNIVYSVNSSSGKFQAPAFGEAFKVSGPAVSTSRSTQWVNGHHASMASTEYVYYVVARQEGVFTIPSARYVMKDKSVSSAPLTINVTAGSTTQPSTGSSSRQNRQSQQGRQAAASGEEVFIRLLVSDRDVYVGEPVEATLKLYTRIRIGNPGTGIAYPDLKGFLKESLTTAPLSTLNPEEINGVTYYTGIVDKVMLYPQVPGDLTIDKTQMQVLVEQRSGIDDFFGDVFQDALTIPRTLATVPVTVHVKPLPSPQPTDFYGAVGRFEISSSLSKTALETNDALTFTITLSGTGNINTAGAPEIEVPATVEKYDPKVTVQAGGTSGIKSFEYLLIPRNSGEFEIPAVTYSYFDIATGRYVTLRTQPQRINVTQGSGGGETSSPAMTASREEVKYLTQDIRFIKTGSDKLRMKGRVMVENTSYFLTYLLALALALAAFVVLRRLHRINADINLSRNRKAAMVAGKRLKKAQESLKLQKYDEMNAELSRAIWGYLSDKLLIPLSDLTRDRCFETLRSKGVSDDLVRELDSVMSACEYSSYAPSSGSVSSETLFNRSETLLRSLENIL